VIVISIITTTIIIIIIRVIIIKIIIIILILLLPKFFADFKFSSIWSCIFMKPIIFCSRLVDVVSCCFVFLVVLCLLAMLLMYLDKKLMGGYASVVGCCCCCLFVLLGIVFLYRSSFQTTTFYCFVLCWLFVLCCVDHVSGSPSSTMLYPLLACDRNVPRFILLLSLFVYGEC